MPSPNSRQKEEFVMRNVPPGSLNKDKYYLILGNLPFEKDWKGLRDWLNTELQRRAPPGKRDEYKVEFTSTLRLGTGWARVRGLEVFNTAARISTRLTNSDVDTSFSDITAKVPYHGRNLMVFDNNRNEWVQIMDSPARKERKSNSESNEATVSAYNQPSWTFDPESSREKYETHETQYQQPAVPLEQAASLGYSQQYQNPVSPQGYYYADSTATTAIPPSYSGFTGCSSFSPTSPHGEGTEWSYATMNTAAQQYWSQGPPTDGGATYVGSEISHQSPQCIDYQHQYQQQQQQQQQQQPEPMAASYVPTEQRQVLVRGIPIKVASSSSSSSSSSSRRKDRPRTREEVRQWLKDAVSCAGYNPAEDFIERIVVEHKTGDPSTLKGYAVLHMKSAQAALDMVGFLENRDYDGRRISAALGKDATTVAPAASSPYRSGYSAGAGSSGHKHHFSSHHKAFRGHHSSGHKKPNGHSHGHHSTANTALTAVSASDPPLIVSGASGYSYGATPVGASGMSVTGGGSGSPNKPVIAMGSRKKEKDDGKKKKRDDDAPR